MHGLDDLALAEADGDALFDEERFDVVLVQSTGADDLAEAKRHPVERVVTGAFGGLAKPADLTVDSGLSPARGVGDRSGSASMGARRGGSIMRSIQPGTGGISAPPLASAYWLPARWRLGGATT